MSISLNNQVALIIGASSGIGRATAVQFAHQGAQVMASARREGRLKDLREELTQIGRAIEIFPADASDSLAMQKLAEQTLERFGKIDLLVYAAGTNTPDRAMTRLSQQTWDRMISVNLNGAYYITQAVLRSMRAARSGHLIYISSVAAMVPDASGSAYQAGKRGIAGLAHAVRFEEKGKMESAHVSSIPA